MSRLLITGGAGFIGANFVHYWLREHPSNRLVVLDALTYAGNVSTLVAANGSDLRFVHGNICNADLVERLLREECIDTIVHFAAESDVDNSILRPDAFLETNVIGTHCLLRCARKVWLGEPSLDHHRFHHVSTDEVFGSLEENDPAFREESRFAPNSPYAASKAASDCIVRAYHRTYGLNTTTSNCSNNYGPFQYPEKLIPLMIVNALNGRPLPLYGDGNNIRDWMHVDDHCRALDSMLRDGTAGGVYVIGGDSQYRNIDIVHRLCTVIDHAFNEDPGLRMQYPQCPAARGEETSSLIRLVADRPGHDRRCAVDCSKIKFDLGYTARVSLDRGLRDTFAWYAQNHWWWAWTMQDGDVAQVERSSRWESMAAKSGLEQNLSIRCPPK